MEHACASGEVEYRKPNFEEMETLPYDVTQYQPVLFVWDSFEEMYEKTKNSLVTGVLKTIQEKNFTNN